MSAMADLHLHTLASDGRLTPTELVRLAAARGLRTIAVTDHDTTDGLAEAFDAAKEFPGLRVIPGIELSADIPGDEVHVLGYFIDPGDPELQAELRRFRAGRVDRARTMVEKLAQLGVFLEWERVQHFAGDGAVGRPHVAMAMVEAGYCQEPKDAFSRILGAQRAGLCGAGQAHAGGGGGDDPAGRGRGGAGASRLYERYGKRHRQFGRGRSVGDGGVLRQIWRRYGAAAGPAVAAVPADPVRG